MPIVLETTRLRLREFSDADVEDLYRSDGDARVMRYLANGLAPRSRDEVAASLRRLADLYAAQPGRGLLHASRRDDGSYVGGCGLFTVPDGDDVEIAYRLPVDCWGQGYATEMARAVLAHGLDAIRLPRVVGLAWPENVASHRVLEKIGMQRRGTEVHYGRPMHVWVADGR